MKTALWIVGMVAIVLVGTIVVVGCGKVNPEPNPAAGPAERAGAALDKAAEKTGEALKQTAEATKDATNKTLEKTGEVLEKVGAAVEKKGTEMKTGQSDPLKP